MDRWFRIDIEASQLAQQERRRIGIDRNRLRAASGRCAYERWSQPNAVRAKPESILAGDRSSKLIESNLGGFIGADDHREGFLFASFGSWLPARWFVRLHHVPLQFVTYKLKSA